MRVRWAMVSVAAVASALVLGPQPPRALAQPTVTYSNSFGFSGPAGLYAYGMAYDATDNTVLVSDYWNNRVKRFTADGNYVGIVSHKAPKGANGGICVPYGVASDPGGNVWVADENCSRVVEFDHSGNWIRTIGRGGTPSYNFGCGGGKMNVPTYVLVDPNTLDVYVSDPKCGAVDVYGPTGTFLYQFNFVPANLPVSKLVTRGIAEDSAGNIYVAENDNQVIVEFDNQGNWIRNFPSVPNMNDVRGIAIDTSANLLFAVSAYSNRIFVFNLTSGAIVPTNWTGSGTTPFDSIRYLATDNNGHVWVGDTWGYTVWKFDDSGNSLPWASAPAPPPPGGYNLPMGVAVSSDGTLFVMDPYAQRGQAFKTSSTCPRQTNCLAWLFAFGSRSENQPDGFSYPRTVEYGGGYIWVGDGGGNNDIQQWTTTGTFVNRFGSAGTSPGHFLGGVYGLAYANGQIYATDPVNCRLQIFATSGALLSYMGSCGTGANQMTAPQGVAVNGSNAYAVESSKNRISVWDTNAKTSHVISPVCDGLGLSGPLDDASDPTDTWLYIADTQNKRVVRMSPDGTTCQTVITGADVPVTAGVFGAPRYLNFAPDGRLYVSTNTRHVYAFTLTG